MANFFPTIVTCLLSFKLRTGFLLWVFRAPMTIRLHRCAQFEIDVARRVLEVTILEVERV